ncbi:hypothetical protein I8751_26845 [Nostocaceae cyanobacterium CENA357]|uniref:Uncharacterized protein n=1 Tax=Atlanticothrix silvestris CENA357 TaxID=1725252 RepID=A0A8J7L5J2_9CYAN|nr:hypothetical protein [Atlanticothrix silvestris CENA357]
METSLFCFLITICKAGSSFQHSTRNSNPGFSFNTSASFSFCIRPGRAFDRAAIAQLYAESLRRVENMERYFFQQLNYKKVKITAWEAH